MSRAGVLPILGLAFALAGCPIPQALPEYNASTITPPRILVDRIATSDLGRPGHPGDGNPIIFVPANCASSPVYVLSARVNDPDPTESIDSRWFVNYDPRFTLNRTWVQQVPVPATGDTTNLERDVPAFVFTAYDFAPSPGAPSVSPQPAPGGGSWYPQEGILRVVELVVSNGFDASQITTTTVLPNRAARTGFETQVHRWVFLSSSAVGCD